jgi:hypothetical protein
MYAQIMVEVGHLRPAVMAMVVRLEGSQADMPLCPRDVCLMLSPFQELPIQS